jgi:O-methyltransferase involved in polyketide biosynthesis
MRESRLTYQAAIAFSAVLVSFGLAQYITSSRRTKPNINDNSDRAYSSVKDSKQQSPQYTYEERKAIAASVSVKPPSQLPPTISRLASRAFRRIIQLAHVLDSTTPPNSFLSLSCMWWKTIAANDVASPVFDNGLAYDLLPSYSRWIVSPPLCKFYPRLLHANIEIRTAFLDRAVTMIATMSNKSNNIRLITLGGGYDTRSMKLLERGVIQEAVELDLPAVVQAKERLLQRLESRRKQQNIVLPTCHGVDLNKVSQVREILKEIFAQDDVDSSTVTIFLFEAVFLYLNPDIPTALLQLCSGMSQTRNSWLCLVDRLEGFVGDDRNKETARQVLAKSNWELEEYSPKPGATRHMVMARAIV